MKKTNLESFLIIVEEINGKVDELVGESFSGWTGDTLLRTNDGDDVLGSPDPEEEKEELDKIKGHWDENFIRKDDNDEYDLVTEEQLSELIGKDGAKAIKNLSSEDIESLVILKGAPQLRGYILKSGIHAGKLVLRPLVTGAKMIKGLVVAKSLTSKLTGRTSKSIGFCFCNELVNKHDDSSSNGNWGKIYDNIKDKVKSGEYTKGQGKIVRKSFKQCADDFESNIKDKNKRNKNALDCDIMKDAMAAFDNSMSSIISNLSKYFDIKQKKSGDKLPKGKTVGSILGSAKTIKFEFTKPSTNISKTGGGNCNSCYSPNPILATYVIEITPSGGVGDRTIKCKWKKQKSGVGFILMEFEKHDVGEAQDVKFTFKDVSGTKLSQTTLSTGKITKIVKV